MPSGSAQENVRLQRQMTALQQELDAERARVTERGERIVQLQREAAAAERAAEEASRQQQQLEQQQLEQLRAEQAAHRTERDALLQRLRVMETDFESLYQVAAPTLELGDELARGLTSIVHRATYYGMPVAVKRFLRNVTPESVAREAKLTSRVHHTNVVRLLGACTDAAARDMHGNELGLCLVMELAQRSLREILSTPELDNPLCDRNVDQQLRKRLLFLAGIANGLRALHSNTPAPIVHGDVKPENLLVVEDSRTAPRPLVCDLGFSTRGEEQAGGTLVYQAPELLAGDRPTPASDVFACGLLMWEVATFGRDGGLWAGQPQAAIIRAVSNGQRPPLTHHCQPPELQTLISRCWDQRPERRPSMAEVAEVLTLLTGQIAVRSTAQSTVSVVRSMPWRFRDHPLSKALACRGLSRSDRPGLRSWCLGRLPSLTPRQSKGR